MRARNNQFFSILLLLVLTLVLQSSQGEAKTPGPLKTEVILKRYSLEKLDSAALLLRVIVDQEQLPKTQQMPPVSCAEISSQEAGQLLNPLHSLLDDKLRMEKKRLPIQGKRLLNVNQCEVHCHCGIYGTLLENNKTQGELGSACNKKASKQGMGDSLRCAKESTWFCKSPLLQYLRKEIESG